MAKKPEQDKNENLRKYKERLKGYSKEELTPLDHEPTIDELAAAGEKLLPDNVCSTPAKKMSPKTESKPPVSSGNPYLLARNQILAKGPDWKRAEILKMEREKNTDNRFYLQFVEDTRYLGDQLSR